VLVLALDPAKLLFGDPRQARLPIRAGTG